jgi:hypothetical protein
MRREINTNETIAEKSDADWNLDLPVQKPLFTDSSVLKFYSGFGADYLHVCS